MRCQNRSVFAFVVSCIFVPFAIAQEGLSQTDDPISIEAQPLAEALKDFSDQTGLQLAYLAALAENRTSGGVESAASPAAALDAILDNTGLEYRFVNDETVAITVADDGRGEGERKMRTPQKFRRCVALRM